MDFNADGYADVVAAHQTLYRGSATGLVAEQGPARPMMFSTIEIVLGVAGPSGNVATLVRGGKGGVIVTPPKK